ncbi:MAG: right-handed parallel beta-helix repeat-containing protein [Caldilineaceae bacterium]|nr:right-handed parallel beta-helix repeat-containing protein [Caldilineaceae bacterium]
MSSMPFRRFSVLIVTTSLLLLGLFLVVQPSGVTAAVDQPNAAASTVVSGTISANTTWTVAASPYVITDDLTVAAGVKLTIQPGVQVLIAENRAITVAGALDAIATATTPITFNAVNNNMWYSLIFPVGSSGTLAHVWMAHGGLLTADGMVSIASNDVTVRDSVFTYGGQDYNDALLYVQGASPVIEGNEFSNSSAIGIRVEGYDSARPLVLRNNFFSNTPDVAVHVTMREETQGILFEGNTSSGRGRNGVRIGDGGFDRSPYLGIITGTVTITGQSDFPILVESPYLVTVPEESKLILTAGTTVKLMDERIDVRGALLANGTAEAPVVFTSQRDDSFGGDTNSDGTKTSPAPGDWRNIIFAPTSTGSKLLHTWIGYGGYSTAEGMVIVGSSDVLLDHVTLAYGVAVEPEDQDAALRIEQASPTIRNSTFLSNTYWAVHWNGFDQNKPVVFEDNQFTDNGTGAVWAMLDSEHVDVTVSGNSSSGSKFNGFMITDMNNGTPGIAGTVAISGQTDFPFIVGKAAIAAALTTRNLTVGAQGHLILPSGTLIKQSTCIEVFGQLTAEGTAANPIVLTSILDDSIGGDTNGDGATAVSPAEISGGVRFRPGSQGSISQAQIRYGGDCAEEPVIETRERTAASSMAANVVIESDDVVVQQSEISHAGPEELGAGIVISASSPSVLNNQIHSNSGSGVQMRGDDVNPTVISNRIYENSVGVHFVDAHSTVALRYNEIFDNVSDGVHGDGNSVAMLRRNLIQNNGMGAVQQSSTHVEIDARLNYWGNASGPYHATKNPNGMGNGVSDDVLFGIWMGGFPNSDVYLPFVSR